MAWTGRRNVCVGQLSCAVVAVLILTSLGIAEEDSVSCGDGASCPHPQGKAPGTESVENVDVFLKAREQHLQELGAKQAEKNASWWQDIAGKAQMQLHFATPIYRTNIRKFMDAEVVEHVNKVLGDVIVQQWNDYVDSLDLSSHINKDRRSYNEVNNGFYQQQGDLLEGLREMKMLKSFWDINVAKFMANLPGLHLNTMPTYLSAEGNNVYAYWAAVSKWGIDHQPHVHFKSAVSGVYYVRTPALAGEIKFHDPRGFPQYPFERPHYIAPEDGDLVLFPGWLPHAVLPTIGKEPRVAIAFNLEAPPYAWYDTAFVHTTVDVP